MTLRVDGVGMETEMKMFEYEIDDNVYVCCINNELGGIEITGYRGNGTRLELPEQIPYEGAVWAVRGIGKKAFSGNQKLRSMVLPATLQRIDDWAFSQCEQLEGIRVLRNQKAVGDFTKGDSVIFGSGVFADCRHIRYIAVGVEEDDDAAVLLATTIYMLPSEYLLTDPGIGEEHWYQKWDLRLRTFLTEKDEEGYTNMVLCGEEDICSSEPEFAAEKRRRKAGLCLCRLQHDEQLPEDIRQVYIQFLISHTKGCESEATWEYIVRERGDDLAYYKLLAEIGGITGENIDDMVQDLNAQHAEAKAYLLHYKQEHFAVKDVFDMFSI